MISGRGRHLSGLAAEEVAARLYVADGAEVLATRWRCPEGEIDLVLGLPGTIVFVEVKARRDRDSAAASISARQLQRLGAAATRFLAERTDGARACRFDVVLIDRSGRAERIVDAARFDGW